MVTDIYTDGGWKRICPVCGAVTALHEQHITPDQADATAGSAYNKATDGQYGEAERLFWEAYCASTDEGRKSGYLWWAVKCCFGIEYVKETLYENDPQRRQDTYVPIFARFPLNADILGPSKPETLRGFEGYLQGQPHAGLKSLYTEMRALYMETVNAMQKEMNRYDVFIAWHDREGSNRCQRFAEELSSYLNQRRQFSFVSSVALRNQDIWHYEPYIYAALATAKVFVIVIEDYEALGRKFLKWEIICMKLRKEQDARVKILFNGMCGHTGHVPAIMEGWQRHYEDSELTRNRVELVGRDVIDAIRDSNAISADQAARMQKPLNESQNRVVIKRQVIRRKAKSRKQLELGTKPPSEDMDAAREEERRNLRAKQEELEDSPQEVDETRAGKEGGSAKEYRNEAREKEAMEKWETDEDSSEAVKDKPEQKEDESPYQTGFQSGGYTYYVQEDGSACITNYKGLGYVLNLPKELNGHAVKRIGRGAFANRSMVSITLPDTLTAIGDGAFERCSSLGSIKLPDGMTAIGDRAFSGCHSLRSIQLPAGIKAIGDEAFDRCSSLDNVELPDTLIAIGDRAFGGCRSLQSMTIPKGVNEIGYSAFKNCDALTLNVKRGSYAQGYAEKKGIPYVLG